MAINLPDEYKITVDAEHPDFGIQMNRAWAYLTQQRAITLAQETGHPGILAAWGEVQEAEAAISRLESLLHEARNARRKVRGNYANTLAEAKGIKVGDKVQHSSELLLRPDAYTYEVVRFTANYDSDQLTVIGRRVGRNGLGAKDYELNRWEKVEDL